MKPVPCAGYRFGMGFLEVVRQSRSFRTLQEAFVCVQQQHRAAYARPERNVIFRREPVGRPRALVWIEFPAVGVVLISSCAESSEMPGKLRRQSLVVCPHLRGRFLDRAIA